jgi:hypothetical protein
MTRSHQYQYGESYRAHDILPFASSSFPTKEAFCPQQPTSSEAN